MESRVILPEILHAIFLRTIAPSFLLEPSLRYGKKSAWCQSVRDKKSIILVCRSWCAVGTVFLYEDIALRRVGQASALLRSLEDNEELAPLIKSVCSPQFSD